MNEVSKQKEKPGAHEKLVNEVSAARTRPTSVEEIMLRRQRRESLKNVKDKTVGAAHLLGNNHVEKASNYHESEKGSDRPKKVSREERVKASSRKKEDAISISREEKLEKPMKEDPVGEAQLLGNNVVQKVSDYLTSGKVHDRSKKVRREEHVKDSSRKKEDTISSSREEKPMKEEDFVGAAQLLGNDLVEKVSEYRASEKGQDRSKKVRHEERVKDSSRKKEDAISSSREEKSMKQDSVGAAQLLGIDLIEKVSDYHASEKGQDRSKKVRREEWVKESSRKKEEVISSSRGEKLVKENPVGTAQLLGKDLVEKASDYHESEKGYDRSEKLRREEHVKGSSRKKEEAISSSREDRLDKQKKRGGTCCK